VNTKNSRLTLIAGVALSALGAVPAHAQTAREAELEARLRMLEAAVADLRSELEQERASDDGAAATQPSASPPNHAEPATKLTAQQSIEDAGPSIEVGGFFKTYAAVSGYSDGTLAANSSGHDFYNPGTIPVGGESQGASFRANVKQTRIALKASAPLAKEVLAGVLEVDFQSSPGSGSHRVTNAYNPALRRAFMSYGNLLIGQEWTNFQYLPALPETADYLGPSEGTVFVRQPQLRYTHALSRAASFSVAAENPAVTTADAGSAIIGENHTGRLPDLTARLNLSLGSAELSLAGLARELNARLGTEEDAALGWGLSVAGKIPLGAQRHHDLRFMVTHGSGIGRYVGLNLAPDAIVVRDGGLRLEPVVLTAGFAALRLGWTKRLRSTFTVSAQKIDVPAALAALDSNDTVWSASANLFYSPMPQVDFGFELRHGERELVSGATGRIDRAEFAAKYSF
jgi:hypothetical protein